jgi:hypothetical protein
LPRSEAYQFDWSHETITLRDCPLTIRRRMKASHSRMPFCAPVCETGTVFDARAFLFYGGACGAASTTT